MIWSSNSSEFSYRNIRLIAKFELFGLSTYLIGIWIVVLEIHRLRELVIYWKYIPISLLLC